MKSQLRVKERLLLATTNQGKIVEIREYLTGLPLEITSLKEVGVKSFYPEKGESFLENAREKSLFYGKQLNILTLAEDSGLEVEQLNGAPGVFSSRFSGPQSTDEQNIEKLLGLMKDIPFEKRKAQFTSCLALTEGETLIKEFCEHVAGFILTERRGHYGFGYDPVFFYPPLNRTFAELLPEEKNRVSHRGRALRRVKAFLPQYLVL